MISSAVRSLVLINTAAAILFLRSPPNSFREKMNARDFCRKWSERKGQVDDSDEMKYRDLEVKCDLKWKIKKKTFRKAMSLGIREYVLFSFCTYNSKIYLEDVGAN